MSKALGINKDLEPLARRVRRLGGSVGIVGSNHVLWSLPDGTIYRTGLTMSVTTAERKRRDIEQSLRVYENGESRHEAQPNGRGKFHVVDRTTGEPVTNGQGFPRTFAQLADAKREARRLDRAG